MKRPTVVLVGSVVGILIALGGLAIAVLFGVPHFEDERAVLREFGAQMRDAEAHHVQVARCARLALEAEHNVDVITRASKLMSELGQNTQVFLRIAEIAAEADRDVPRLDAVLDLAVRKSAGSVYVIELAERATHLDSPDAEARWQAEYDAVLATAEYGSLEEAIEAQRTELELLPEEVIRRVRRTGSE